MPPARVGQQIRVPFIILYVLDENDRIKEFQAVFSSPPTIIEKGGEGDTKLTRSVL